MRKGAERAAHVTGPVVRRTNKGSLGAHGCTTSERFTFRCLPQQEATSDTGPTTGDPSLAC